jgi:polar amino acid transport system substrate-binding protein
MRRKAIVAAALVTAAIALPGTAGARTLAMIKDSGAIALCAHPNALPFASKDGKRHGFQVEMAEALARQLGVGLTEDWVITRYDVFRTDCDLVMDAIDDKEAQGETGLRLSKPYGRSGIVLAVREGEKGIASLKDLSARNKVGVLVSSVAAMTLEERGIETVPDLFEDELLTMVGKREIDAAAVTPIAVGYYNLTHPKQKLRIIHAFDGEPNFTWNIAVGLRRPDPELRQAIDAALDKLLANGTAKRIYARYGVELRPPK